MAESLNYCPMLTGKQEIEPLCYGNGKMVVPTFQECLQEHCAAYVKTLDGGGHCNHYHTNVFEEAADDQ